MARDECHKGALTDLATQLIEASGELGRINRIPIYPLRVMLVLVRPFSPAIAPKAQAADCTNHTRYGGQQTSGSRRAVTEVTTTLRKHPC